MKFAIITHVFHKKQNGNYFGYEPYIREMNLWAKHAEELLIVAPIISGEIKAIEASYKHVKIKFTKVPSFDITQISNVVKSIFSVPIIVWKIFKIMRKADHIHLRCPGNIGLLGCFVQVFFPSKSKTVKYAGNWDPNSKQPLTYNLQKWLLSNTFLTRNCKVLVYGKWKNQSKNIVSFFTASYQKKEIEKTLIKPLNDKTNFVFVGAFSKGKQPLLSVKVIESLSKNGFNVQLDMYGDGNEFEKVQQYIAKNNLKNIITLHGNKSKETVKKAFKKAHFLIFISKSEGWPKVVAEAMFWRCLPVSSPVSCVPFMLDYGKRGVLVSERVKEIALAITKLLKDENIYQNKVEEAQKWSQQYTLDKFESEIKILLSDV